MPPPSKNPHRLPFVLAFLGVALVPWSLLVGHRAASRHDVLTASTSTERTVALLMAALAVLPLTVVCFAVARAPDRFAAQRVR